MRTLSDHLLLFSYKKAKKLKLNDEFIALIEQKIKRRDAHQQEKQPKK